MNIDPYVTDVKYNKNTDPIYIHADTSHNDTFARGNTKFFEVFSLFESIPRYGSQGNLMFQVILFDNSKIMII